MKTIQPKSTEKNRRRSSLMKNRIIDIHTVQTEISHLELINELPAAEPCTRMTIVRSQSVTRRDMGRNVGVSSVLEDGIVVLWMSLKYREVSPELHQQSFMNRDDYAKSRTDEAMMPPGDVMDSSCFGNENSTIGFRHLRRQSVVNSRTNSCQNPRRRGSKRKLSIEIKDSRLGEAEIFSL